MKGKTMAKTHYNPIELTEGMTMGQILMRKAACGTKAKMNAHVYMTNNWEHVDCVKCLDQREAVERQAAHKASLAK